MTKMKSKTFMLWPVLAAIMTASTVCLLIGFEWAKDLLAPSAAPELTEDA